MDLTWLNTDVNMQTGKGLSSLMYATRKDHMEVAKLLIDASAKVNMQCWRGRSAQMHACINGSTVVVQLLLKNGTVVLRPPMCITKGFGSNKGAAKVQSLGRKQ